MKRTPSHNHRKTVQSYPEIPTIDYGQLELTVRLVDKACDVWLMKRARIDIALAKLKSND